MTAQELFLQDKALAGWWKGVVKDERFEKVLLHVKAGAFTKWTNEQIAGAARLIETLETIAGSADIEVAYPSPGLIHDLTIKAKETP